MSSKIGDYMDHLTENKLPQDAHKADPQAAMTRFGLNAAERAVVATGDHEQIRTAVAKADPTRVRPLHITFSQ